MFKFLKLNFIILSVIGLILLASFNISSNSRVEAQANSTKLIGYAWSENIGWISFSSENVQATESLPCTPDSPLTQTLTCPSGQTGEITQERTSTCPGPVTSEWTTTNNTCATANTVPTAPTNANALAINTKSIVSFTAPTSNGGSAITGYTVTSNPGGIIGTGASSPITVNGLTNGTSYTFTVKATNSVGTGPDSTPTNSVKPASRIFTTSTTYNGNIGGLTGADNICQTRANAGNLGGVWKAWLSDSNTSAASRLNHNNYYVLLNGTVVANNWADLTDGTLASGIYGNEYNSGYGGFTWTGTLYNGNSSTYNCNNWTNGVSSYTTEGTGDSGWPQQTSGTGSFPWTGSSRNYCESKFSLYCFEQ